MFTRRTRHRILAALTAPALLAAGLATMGLTAAGAQAAPLQLRPESFTITIDNNAQFGQASGPVRGFFRDESVSATDEVLVFAGGTVNLDHTAVRQPRLNRFTCTGFLTENGRWEMNGLSGRDRNAFGFGRFTIFESVSAPRDRGRCDVGDESFRAFVDGSGVAANGR